MIAAIFRCVMKSHLFAMFLWNFTTTSLSIAEILLFIKRWSKIAVSNIAIRSVSGEFFTFQQDNAPTHHARETVEMLSRETPDFISPLQWPDLNPVDYEIWGRLQERVYRSRIRDVNHLKERLIEVRLASQHHLCGSESVVNSSASLRACWWRALWTSVVTATTTVTDIYRLNW